MAKEYAYITQDGEEFIVTEFARLVTIRQGRRMACYNSMDEVEKILAAKGCTRKGFQDEQGVTRHAMRRGKVESLYNQLQDFIADCTVEEYKAHEQAFAAVKTLLHQYMQ